MEGGGGGRGAAEWATRRARTVAANVHFCTRAVRRVPGLTLLLLEGGAFFEGCRCVIALAARGAAAATCVERADATSPSGLLRISRLAPHTALLPGSRNSERSPRCTRRSSTRCASEPEGGGEGGGEAALEERRCREAVDRRAPRCVTSAVVRSTATSTARATAARSAVAATRGVGDGERWHSGAARRRRRARRRARRRRRRGGRARRRRRLVDVDERVRSGVVGPPAARG